MTEPIGIILEGNTAPFVAGMTAADQAAATFGRTVTDASAATKRAMIQMVTATDDETKALAAQKLAAASAMDALAAYGKEQSATVAKTAAAADAIKAQNTALATGLLSAAGAGRATTGIAAIGTSAKTAGSALRGMGAISAIALAGVGYESTKAAMTFGQTTARLQTQAGATTEQLKTMTDGIKSLVGQTATAPQALASAIYEVASAGYKGADAVTVMKQAALGAKVGNADLNETTSSLVATMKALNAPASDATKTMASLNSIVGAGKMTMDQLNAALGTGIVPTAKSFGVSLDSLGAALAYMTDRGTPADQAATRLRMTMSLMADPTAKAAKALGAIGLQGPAVKAATQDMADALAKAGVTTSKMASDLRQPDGIQVALVDMKSHLEAAGLSANAASAVMARAFGGGKSDSAILELIQNVGGLKDKFDQVQQGGAKWASDVATTFKQPAVQAQQFSANVRELELELGQRLLPVVEVIVGWLAKHKDAMVALAVVMGGVAITSVVAFVASLSAATVVIIGVGAAVAGLIVLGTDLADHWKSVSGALNTAWNTIKNAFSDAYGKIAPIVQHLVTDLLAAFFGLPKQMYTAGANTIIGLAKGIADSAGKAIDAAGHVAEDVIHQVLGVFGIASPSKVMAAVGGNVSTGLANGIADNGWQPIQAIANVANTVVGVASAAAQTAFADLQAVATATAQAQKIATAPIPKQSLGGLLGAFANPNSPSTTNANPVPGQAVPSPDQLAAGQGSSSSLLQLLGGTVTGGKYTAQQLAIVKWQNILAGLNENGSAKDPYGSTSIPGLGDGGAGGYSPSGSGGSGASKKAIGPYSGFQNVLKLFGSKEQTDFGKQATITTMAQVTAATKTDEALKKLAEAHLKHAQTLVKTASSAKNKAAATSLVVTAQRQLNAVTGQLTKVQNDGKAITAAATKAATALADARLEASVNMLDQATADRVHIIEAAEALAADTKGTLAYYQDLKTYNEAVATGASDAATAAQQAQSDLIDLQNAMVQAGIDWSNPLSSLQAAVTEAQNTLAGDTQGTTKFYTDTSALNEAVWNLSQATQQNTSATTSNTQAMTGVQPGGQLPGYLADAVTANAGAYIGPVSSSRGGGLHAPIYINVQGSVVGGSPDQIAKALEPYVTTAQQARARRNGG